jgi:hypothetical protein
MPLPGRPDLAEDGGPNVKLIVGIAAGLLVALVGIVFVLVKVMNPPAPRLSAPSGFVAYAPADNAFKCEAPEGWEKSEAGGGGMMSGAVWKKGHAKIDVDTDLQGSLMGDIMESSNRQIDGMGEGANPMPMPTPKPAVEKLHEMDAKKFAAKYADYEEKPMETVTVGFGEARCSEWTGKKSLGVLAGSEAVHGYRVTALGNERRLTVTCVCPEEDWAALKPAFEKVITSVQSGGR